MDKNYYSILNCVETSTEEELKKSFQELALKFHPDKIGDNSQNLKFYAISEAWEVLRDPKTRRAYDIQLKRLRLEERPPIYAMVAVEEMDQDCNSTILKYSCRCGGCYSVDREELLPPECLVGCDECSFNILITI